MQDEKEFDIWFGEGNRDCGSGSISSSSENMEGQEERHTQQQDEGRMSVRTVISHTR